MCYFQCVKYYLIITAVISFSIVYFIKKRILGIAKTMSLYNTEMEDPMSDEEVYFGKLTLKELKKHILWEKQPKTICALSAVNSPTNSGDHNESLQILQAHSQPNLISDKAISDLNSPVRNCSAWDMRADDSFIKMENMVAKLCLSPRKNDKTEELNNTLEVIEYILNNPPSSVGKDKNNTLNCIKPENTSPKSKINGGNHQTSPLKYRVKNNVHDSPQPPQNTPVKTTNKPEGFMTPMDMKHKPIFKTPGQPLSSKKSSATSLKKTPGRSNAYQHISSPVASYIKNCPIAPLVKDVHPKKPLPGPSSIPKFVKNPSLAKPSNKENVILPSVAYKSAKKTKVIEMADEQKLPQCQWAKKMTSVSRPLVMKHDHRELNYAKKKLLPQQEDSFADLSYHQAEVSVCTQKSAFKTKKNF